MSNKLVKNTLIYSVGTFGSKILTFLLVPLYSYYLNREEFGYFDLINTTISLIIPFLTLQVSDSVFRWLITSRNKRFIIGLTITNGLFLLFISSIIVFFISFLLSFFTYIKEHWLICFVVISSMAYPFFQQITRGLGLTKLYTVNGLLFTFIFLLSNILLLVFLKLGINGMFYSIFITNVIASILIILRVNIIGYLKISLISFKFLKQLVSYSIPLIPNTISWWMINSASKFLILVYIGVEANGLYAMANRFPVILVMVNQVFTLAWQEQAILSLDSKSNSENYSNVLEGLIRIQFICVAILTLISQFLCYNFLSDEFYDSWRYMPILYLSVALLSFAGFYGAIYLGLKQTSKIFTTTIYGGLTSLIIAFALITVWGLYGVAIGTAIGYLILLIIRMKSINNFLKFSFPSNTFLKYILLVIVSFIVAYQANIFYSLIALLIVVLWSLRDNKHNVTKLFSYIF